jgi:hypothetical protein
MGLPDFVQERPSGFLYGYTVLHLHFAGHSSSKPDKIVWKKTQTGSENRIIGFAKYRLITS